MFNGKRLENIDENIIILTELIVKIDKRLIELKILTMENNKQILTNKVELLKQR